MQEKETVAVIDLGTNTFHLLIVDILHSHDIVIREKMKEPVKLGQGGMTSGRITNGAFDRGIKALKNFRKFIDFHSVSAAKIFAFATSAVRTASNAKAFIDAAKKEAGIPIRVINGNEEASLIYQGVRSAVRLPLNEDVLIVDIGGGSVEFIVCNAVHTKLLRSLKIGAGRLLEIVKPQDPITPADVQALEKYLRAEMTPLLEELRDFKIKKLVGSSGSFETFGEMIIRRSENHPAISLNGFSFFKTDFDPLCADLICRNREERLEMPGMEPLRVDLIVMSAIMLRLLLSELPVNEITVSTAALKEGILQDFLEQERIRHQLPHTPGERHLRSRAVRNLARRMHSEMEHGKQVAKLALEIFDQTQKIHQLQENDRELLEYGSILHDIGKFINRSGHHKHGQYIIQNAGLPSFSSDEILVLSNLVRYHRKSLPSRDHLHFKILYPEIRRAVRILAGIIRIADNLDRGHRNLVTKTEVFQNLSQELEIRVHATENVDIEIGYARENREMLEQVLEIKINILAAKPNPDS